MMDRSRIGVGSVTHNVVLTALCVSIALCTARTALACEATMITPGEMVARSDVILRARALRTVKDEGYERRSAVWGYPPPEGMPWPTVGTVEFQVLEVIKGSYSHSKLELEGQTDRYQGNNRGVVPYREVRPGGHGMCHARDYEDGVEFLLVMRDGTPYWAALAPTNEAVSGEHDPWVMWVRGVVEGLEQCERRVKQEASP